MYRLLCRCGLETSVRGAQAGSVVTCQCGEHNRVPPLRELKDHEQSGTAVRAVSDSPIRSGDNANDAASEPRAEEDFVHCLGVVGGNGNVSALSMNHYVELVIARVRDGVNWNDAPTNAELLVSVALSPNGQKRIEFDIRSSRSDFPEQTELTKLLEAIETPVVHDSPIAFAFYKRARDTSGPGQPMLVFPSLSESIKSQGFETAIRVAFDMETASTTKQNPEASQRRLGSWWRKLFAWCKPKTTPVQPKPSAQQMYLSHVDWVNHCEAMAERISLIDLKRAVIEDPDDMRHRVALARKYGQQQAWVLAIGCYDDVLARIEYCVPLLSRRARLHRFAGNSALALNDYTKAIEQAPQEPLLYQRRSSIYEELEAWDQAKQDLDAAIGLASRDPELYYHRAQVHLQRGNGSDAIPDLKEAVRLDPNFGHAHFRLGWLEYCLDRTDAMSAIEHLTRAIELIGGDTSARIHRSIVYVEQGKFALAMEDCDSVIAHEADNAFAHGVRGRVLQCEGEYDEAIIACTRAIELGHEHAAVYLARAYSYASTGQPTLAESDCVSALALEPNNAWAVQLQGKLSLQSGDLDAAMQLFHQARSLAPDWAEPRQQLSLIHRLKEDPLSSIEEQTALIEQQPRQSAHFVNRAFAFTQLGNFQAAADDYDRALELDPENEQIYFLRGVFRMNCQEDDLALADFDRVLAIVGDDDNTRAHRASVLLRSSRHQEAIDDYAKLIAKYPDNPYAYNGRAFAFASLGHVNHAQEDVQRLNEIVPEHAAGHLINVRLADAQRLLRDESYDAALDIVNEIIVENAEMSVGYRVRAHVHWEREEYVEACDDYTRVMEMDGPTADCLSARGQVQAELGEWDRALADLNQAIELARKSGQTLTLAYALNGRSLTLAGMGRDEESRRDFEESVSLCPTNPWVYYHQGMRRYQLDELTEARILLELALDFNEPPLSKRKKQRARKVLDKVLAELDPASSSTR